MALKLGRLLAAKSNGQLVEALYAAMVVVSLGIALVGFRLDYEKTLDDIEHRARAYSISMATDVRWYVDVARQTLHRTIDRLEDAPQSLENNVLSQALSELPAGVVIALYDAAGDSRAFIGYASAPINISDRHYFQELRGGEEWVISNLIADRVTGTKTFAIGISLYENGQFSGAAVAYAPMRVFSESWLSVGGTNSNAFLVHHDGWITARLPPIDSEVYDAPVAKEFVDSFSEDNGSYWAAPSPIDGIERVLGYARVPSSPVVAVIGISPAEQLAQFWWRVAVSLLILTPILVILGLASWRIRNLIAEQERTADELASSLKRNEELFIEIHHRVKNNLQSVLSLIRALVKDRESVAAIEPRILAMAAVHEHIYGHNDFVVGNAANYISDIAQKVIYASSGNLGLTTDIADIELPSKVMMPLGQLLNEAIINAVKYGYSDGRRGNITIHLDADVHDLVTLTIHNDGDPLPKNAEKGMGSRLLGAFATQLGGTIDTASTEQGVTLTVQFPKHGA